MDAENFGGLAVIAGCIFGLISLFHGWGTRGIKDAYTFQYQGKPATLKHQDIRWGPDRYYFSINGKDELTGRLITEDGKEIETYGNWRQDNNKYFIRDKPIQQ